MKETIQLNLNPLQMEQIKKAVKAGLDVTTWNNKAYTWEHMEAIRLLQQEGYDFSPLLDPTLSEDEVQRISLGIEIQSGDLVLDEEAQLELDTRNK